MELEPLLLRPTEVGKLLGLGRSTVFAMLATGELPVVRLGRSVRVPREALERWIRERTLESHGTGVPIPSQASAEPPSRIPLDRPA